MDGFLQSLLALGARRFVALSGTPRDVGRLELAFGSQRFPIERLKRALAKLGRIEGRHDRAIGRLSSTHRARAIDLVYATCRFSGKQDTVFGGRESGSACHVSAFVITGVITQP